MAKIDSVKNIDEKIVEKEATVTLEELNSVKAKLEELTKQVNYTTDINKKIAYERENKLSTKPAYSYASWGDTPIISWKMQVDRVYDGGKTEEQEIRLFFPEGKHKDVSFIDFQRNMRISDKKTSLGTEERGGKKYVWLKHDDGQDYEFCETFLNP